MNMNEPLKDLYPNMFYQLHNSAPDELRYLLRCLPNSNQNYVHYHPLINEQMLHDRQRTISVKDRIIEFTSHLSVCNYPLIDVVEHNQLTKMLYTTEYSTLTISILFLLQVLHYMHVHLFYIRPNQISEYTNNRHSNVPSIYDVHYKLSIMGTKYKCSINDIKSSLITHFTDELIYFENMYLNPLSNVLKSKDKINKIVEGFTPVTTVYNKGEVNKEYSVTYYKSIYRFTSLPNKSENLLLLTYHHDKCIYSFIIPTMLYEEAINELYNTDNNRVPISMLWNKIDLYKYIPLCSRVYVQDYKDKNIKVDKDFFCVEAVNSLYTYFSAIHSVLKNIICNLCLLKKEEAELFSNSFYQFTNFSYYDRTDFTSTNRDNDERYVSSSRLTIIDLLKEVI